MPPPGNYFVNYFGNCSGKLKDGSGNIVNLGGRMPRVDATFDALPFIHITDRTVLGGNWGWHLIVPLVDQRVDKWHTAIGMDIYLPVGKYDKTDPRKSIGNWGLGVNGYFLKQLSDDKQGGVKVGTDGNRGQVLAIGPCVKYQSATGAVFVGQWQHETHVENRFGGDKVWLKLITPI